VAPAEKITVTDHVNNVMDHVNNAKEVLHAEKDAIVQLAIVQPAIVHSVSHSNHKQPVLEHRWTKLVQETREMTEILFCFYCVVPVKCVTETESGLNLK
jgi:hypothetical protein